MKQTTIVIIILIIVGLAMAYVVRCGRRWHNPRASLLSALQPMQKLDMVQKMILWRQEMSQLDALMHDITPDPDSVDPVLQ